MAVPKAHATLETFPGSQEDGAAIEPVDEFSFEIEDDSSSPKFISLFELNNLVKKLESSQRL